MARQWELLKLLPAKPTGKSAAQLHRELNDAGYTVSKRTVERDLRDLSSIFALQTQEGSPAGWFLGPNAASALQSLTLGEALTMRLVEQSVRPLLPSFMRSLLEPRFDAAKQKLAAMADGDNAARWIDKVASVYPELTQQGPSICPELLETVQSALFNDTQLSCCYYSAHKNQTSELVLNPLGLVQRSHTTYLIATAEPFADIRQFVLHRFQAAQNLDTPLQKPDGFTLEKYIAGGAMQFGLRDKIQMEAWVSHDLARLIEETPIASDMQLHKQEDGAKLTATLNDSWELRWWILSQAGSIRVDKPLTLKAAIAQNLREALALHDAEEVAV